MDMAKLNLLCTSTYFQARVSSNCKGQFFATCQFYYKIPHLKYNVALANCRRMAGNKNCYLGLSYVCSNIVDTEDIDLTACIMFNLKKSSINHTSYIQLKHLEVVCQNCISMIFSKNNHIKPESLQ